MVLVQILYALLATTFIIGKAALYYIAPLWFIGLRMTIAGISLLTGWYITSKERLQLRAKHWVTLSGIMVFHIFIPYTSEFWALQYLSAAKTALIYNLSPFITALLTYKTHRLSRVQWLSLIIGFIGLMPLIFWSGSDEIAVYELARVSLPEIALIISVSSAAYGWLLVKDLVTQGYSSVRINGIGMLGGGIGAVCASLLLEKAPRVYDNIPPMSLLDTYIDMIFPIHTARSLGYFYGALLIITANGICYPLYGYLLKHYSATLMAMVGSATPLYTALFGWLLLDEVISGGFVISFICVTAATWLFYKEERRPSF